MNSERVALWQVVVAVLFVVAIGAALALPVLDAPSSEPTTSNNDEPDRAVVAAVRSLAISGLYNPDGHYMSYTGEIGREGNAWTVGFGLRRCGMFGAARTCRPTGTGEVGVTMRLAGDNWVVDSTHGDLPEQPLRYLMNTEQPDSLNEPPHWEFPRGAVAIISSPGNEASMDAAMLWVGPIPYEGPGSACRAVAFDDNGERIYRGPLSYHSPPSEEHGRGGGLMGTDLPDDTTDAAVRCEPLADTRFELLGQPELNVSDNGPNPIVTGTATLGWDGPKVAGTSYWCDVALYDADDELIRRSVAGPSATFWPPSDFKGPPPYEMDMHFAFVLREDAPEPVRAEMDCSLDRPS